MSLKVLLEADFCILRKRNCILEAVFGKPPLKVISMAIYYMYCFPVEEKCL